MKCVYTYCAKCDDFFSSHLCPTVLTKRKKRKQSNTLCKEKYKSPKISNVSFKQCWVILAPHCYNTHCVYLAMEISGNYMPASTCCHEIHILLINWPIAIDGLGQVGPWPTLKDQVATSSINQVELTKLFNIKKYFLTRGNTFHDFFLFKHFILFF